MVAAILLMKLVQSCDASGSMRWSIMRPENLKVAGKFQINMKWGDYELKTNERPRLWWFEVGRLNTFPALSGIACIALSFVDAHGRPLQVPAQGGAALQKSENCSVPLHPDRFNELTAVVKVESIISGSGNQKEIAVICKCCIDILVTAEQRKHVFIRRKEFAILIKILAAMLMTGRQDSCSRKRLWVVFGARWVHK